MTNDYQLMTPLTYASIICYHAYNEAYMRTTIILNDELVAKASELTGIKEKTKLIHKAIEEMIRLENAKRLMAFGGTDPKASIAPRLRSERT